MHCLEEVPWDANMCVHCKAPLNFIASTDPYQSIHVEGFILRTAAEIPRSWWTVIGIWVSMLSNCGPALAIPLVYWLEFGSWRAIPLRPGLVSLVTLPWLVVAVRSTANFYSWRQRSRDG